MADPAPACFLLLQVKFRQERSNEKRLEGSRISSMFCKGQKYKEVASITAAKHKTFSPTPICNVANITNANTHLQKQMIDSKKKTWDIKEITTAPLHSTKK